MFLHPDAPAIVSQGLQKTSQATHFTHQAKHLFADPERRPQALVFLNERTTARVGASQTWDFPDGSAVHLPARGALVVVRGQSSGLLRWLRVARTWVSPASAAQ